MGQNEQENTRKIEELLNRLVIAGERSANSLEKIENHLFEIDPIKPVEDPTSGGSSTGDGSIDPPNALIKRFPGPFDATRKIELEIEGAPAGSGLALEYKAKLFPNEEDPSGIHNLLWLRSKKTGYSRVTYGHAIARPGRRNLVRAVRLVDCARKNAVKRDGAFDLCHKWITLRYVVFDGARFSPKRLQGGALAVWVESDPDLSMPDLSLDFDQPISIPEKTWFLTIGDEDTGEGHVAWGPGSVVKDVVVEVLP